MTYINPRAFNRSIEGYKDKHFKQRIADINATNEIKLRWIYARLKNVVKGEHWKAYAYDNWSFCKRRKPIKRNRIEKQRIFKRWYKIQHNWYLSQKTNTL